MLALYYPLAPIALLICGTLGAPSAGSISKQIFDDLQRYAKYSVTAYKDLEDCVKPLNNTVLHRYDKKSTQGFLVRDDTRKEFILAFRGTEPTKGDGDCSIDLSICKTNLSLPMVANEAGAKVHTGFQEAWGYVNDQIISDLMKELPTRAKYPLIVTGHSLGGAVAAVSTLQIKKSFPKLALRLYSYGAPRVGDLAFVKQIEKTLDAKNIFRGSSYYSMLDVFHGRRFVVAGSNLQDPVSFLPPLLLGYRHFGTGYWLSKEPASEGNVLICTHGEDGDETTDKTCDNVPAVINPAKIAQHSSLFGISTSNAKQWCGGGAAEAVAKSAGSGAASRPSSSGGKSGSPRPGSSKAKGRKEMEQLL